MFSNAAGIARTPCLRRIGDIMRLVGFGFAALVCVAPAQAQDPRAAMAPLPDHCRMAVPADAAVVAYGAYEGTVASTWELAGNAGHQTREIAIHASPQHAAVFLVLSAYDPVIWVIDPVAHEQIRGVLVLGYHSQAIANLPPDTPWKITTYTDRRNANGASAACQTYGYAYEGGRQLDDLDRKVEAVTGRRIDSFAGGYGATAFPASAVRPHPAIADVPTALTAVAKLDIPSGQPGIDELVRRGILRAATAQDIDAWLQQATKNSPTGHLAPVPRSEIRTHKLYVAMKDFRVPAGLYGAHSISVLITEGVNRVTDDGSHNEYFDMASGSACRVDTRRCTFLVKSR